MNEPSQMLDQVMTLFMQFRELQIFRLDLSIIDLMKFKINFKSEKLTNERDDIILQAWLHARENLRQKPEERHLLQEKEGFPEESN